MHTMDFQLVVDYGDFIIFCSPVFPGKKEARRAGGEDYGGGDEESGGVDQGKEGRG